MKKSYCTQPDKRDGESHCAECSLCNYGRDCHNKSITFDVFFSSDIEPEPSQLYLNLLSRYTREEY
jgi:hypothetical protein